MIFKNTPNLLFKPVFIKSFVANLHLDTIPAAIQALEPKPLGNDLFSLQHSSPARFLLKLQINRVSLFEH